MAKPSKEVADFFVAVEPVAREKYGDNWVKGLADDTKIKKKTLETLKGRGQKLRADWKDAIERALGLTSAAPAVRPLVRLMTPDEVRRIAREEIARALGDAAASEGAGVSATRRVRARR